MNSRIKWFLLICLLTISCKIDASDEQIEQWKNEILEIESRFAQMAKEEGIEKAFVFYAAEDGVLNRNNVLVIGKNAIQKRFKSQTQIYQNAILSWKPDFVDVSDSGDLAYTYGSYLFTSSDSLGKKIEDKGVFHTVWKRQADGKWRYVWD